MAAREEVGHPGREYVAGDRSPGVRCALYGRDVASNPTPDSQDRQRVVRLAIAGAIAVLVLLFALFNRGRVEVNWVLFERSSRLIYVIIGSALLGALADRLIQRRQRSHKE